MTLAKNATNYTNYSLQAAGTTVPGDYLVAVRATSGALVYDAPHLIRIVDRLPPPLLTRTFSPGLDQGRDILDRHGGTGGTGADRWRRGAAPER